MKQSTNKKMIKSGGALRSILMRFLLKLIKPAPSLGKNILVPLGLSAEMPATDVAIQKNVWIWKNSKIF